MKVLKEELTNNIITYTITVNLEAELSYESERDYWTYDNDTKSLLDGYYDETHDFRQAYVNRIKNELEKSKQDITNKLGNVEFSVGYGDWAIDNSELVFVIYIHTDKNINMHLIKYLFEDIFTYEDEFRVEVELFRGYFRDGSEDYDHFPGWLKIIAKPEFEFDGPLDIDDYDELFTLDDFKE